MHRPTTPRDLYAALGVAPDASQKEIEGAFQGWRERRRRGEAADEGFHGAERAYHTLAEPSRRERYDLQTGRRRHPAWRGGEGDVARACLRAGLRNLARGREQAALPLLERAVRLVPEDATSRSYLGLVLARSGGSLHEAARHASYAVDVRPRTPAFLCNLAAVYAAAGLRGRALKLRLRAWRLVLAEVVRAKPAGL